MMLRNKLVLLIPALLLPLSAYSQSNIQWSKTEKKYRTLIDNMKVYYEPEKIKKDGDTVSFKTYRSSDPANPDEAGNYVINCSTQEFVSLNAKGEPLEPPMRVLPGEQLHPIGNKLCDWGPGFIRKLIRDS